MNINYVFSLTLLSLFLLMGCGQKGDLYLPDEAEKKTIEVKSTSDSDGHFENDDKNLKRKE